jgi:cobalamin biosynthesis Co2+ chelatase CbiK
MPMTKMKEKYNCVVFCHGNCGNRAAVFECMNFLLKKNLIVCSFDFSG